MPRFLVYLSFALSSIGWLAYRDAYLWNDEATNGLLHGNHPFWWTAFVVTATYLIFSALAIVYAQNKLSWRWTAIHAGVFLVHLLFVEWLIVTECRV